MAEFKLTISNPKTGKTTQREVKDAQANILIGRKIGDKVEGNEVGLAEFEFEITGGSDYSGVPMRRDVQGTARKRIFAISGTGLKRKKRKGTLQRKLVAGNTVHSRTAQVNLKILKEGKEKLFEAKAEKKESKEEAEPKKETKPEEKKQAKPKEEHKSEAKPKAEEKPKEKSE